MKCIFRITACQQETPGVPRLKQTRSCSPSVSPSVSGWPNQGRESVYFYFYSSWLPFCIFSISSELWDIFESSGSEALFSLPFDLLRCLDVRVLDDLLHVLPLTGDVLHRHQPRPVRLHQQQSPPRDHDDCQGDPGHRQHSYPGQTLIMNNNFCFLRQLSFRLLFIQLMIFQIL